MAANAQVVRKLLFERFQFGGGSSAESSGFSLESDTCEFQCTAKRGLTGRRFGSRIRGNTGTWSRTGTRCTRCFVVRLGLLIAV
jgi:hypothetical protein